MSTLLTIVSFVYYFRERPKSFHIDFLVSGFVQFSCIIVVMVGTLSKLKPTGLHPLNVNCICEFHFKKAIYKRDTI